MFKALPCKVFAPPALGSTKLLLTEAQAGLWRSSTDKGDSGQVASCGYEHSLAPSLMALS
jgi:hypothetical protein